jgi:glycosyltransferase involved in cell wall biosynthesis
MPEYPDRTSSKKKRIAVYYPYFMGGGAEAVVLWMLEGLKKQYDLTLFTATNLDFKTLDIMYGTQLANAAIAIEFLSPQLLTVLTLFGISNSKNFRQSIIHLVIRRLKANSSKYDLMLSAYNATDLGKQGIQYIHWVKVNEGKTESFKKISQFSDRQLKSNFSIANSRYVANVTKKTYGIDSAVVYPPVVLNTSKVSWEEKENAFICSGRLVRAKQPHKVIQILKAVRDRGFDIQLYITGGGGGVYEWRYRRFLQKLVKANASWVKLYENLPYEEYAQIVCKCKYGFHFKQEPFGISIAEMVKAGALPFVKNQGGQIEIVGENNPELLFADTKEAVEKIVSVLGDPNKQQKLLNSLETQKQLFSTDQFIQEINKIVASYFDESLYQSTI